MYPHNVILNSYLKSHSDRKRPIGVERCAPHKSESQNKPKISGYSRLAYISSIFKKQELKKKKTRATHNKVICISSVEHKRHTWGSHVCMHIRDMSRTYIVCILWKSRMISMCVCAQERYMWYVCVHACERTVWWTWIFAYLRQKHTVYIYRFIYEIPM